MIVITGENTPLYNFLKPLKCSILILNNRNEEFVHSITELANNESKKQELGQNGYDIIQQYYTKEKVVAQYLNLFENL
jgi:glycosyltransferase involved in cell wall biosynthesis